MNLILLYDIYIYIYLYIILVCYYLRNEFVIYNWINILR